MQLAFIVLMLTQIHFNTQVCKDCSTYLIDTRVTVASENARERTTQHCSQWGSQLHYLNALVMLCEVRERNREKGRERERKTERKGGRALPIVSHLTMKFICT